MPAPTSFLHEPYYLLQARDPIAPFLVSIASHVQNGDWEAAHVVFQTMLDRAGRAYLRTPDTERSRQAIEQSLAMFAWAKANPDVVK